MPHRFQRRQITIPVCYATHVHSYQACLATCQLQDITVTELVGTGLAIQQLHDRVTPGRYTMVHTASGTRVSARAVSSVVEAGRWIRAIAPLCDWTQPASTFRLPQGMSGKSLAHEVECARMAALCETSNRLSWAATHKQGYHLREQDGR